MEIKYTIAFYIRVSNKECIQNSIENQKKILYQYVESKEEFKNSNIIVKIDEGYTGTNFNRPEFLELLLLIKEKKVQCIIVKDLSRLGRDYIEISDYLEYFFPQNYIRFISINDNYDSFSNKYFSNNPETGIINLVNELYSRDLSEKVRTVIRQKQKKGEYKVPYPFYGYQYTNNRHELKINKETASVVKQIFDMSEKGMKKSEIAKYLNDQEILSPQEYAYQRLGKKKINKIETVSLWSASIITRILSDERYTGVMILHQYEIDGVRGKVKRVAKEDWVRVENHHENIISKDLYKKVHKNRKYVKKKKIKEKTIYFCKYCGHVLYKKNNLYYCKYGKYKTNSECQKIKIEINEIEGVIDLLLLKLIKTIDVETIIKEKLLKKNNYLKLN